MTTTRRHFLGLSAKLAGLGMMSPGVARGQSAESDYKALVCVYLFGGNDGNNLIVPLDASRYAAYTSIRGPLALGASRLTSPIADAAGNPWGLHYGLAALRPLYDSGALAFLLNVGLLEKPLTRATYLAGEKAPTNLFSHSDQTVQAQTGMPTPNGSGWGGRLLEAMGRTDTLGAVSMSQPAVFVKGVSSGGNVIPPGVELGLYGMSFWPASEARTRRQAVDQLLRLDGGNPIRGAANRAMADGLVLADTLAAARTAPQGSVTFPGTSIGNQLREVARLVRAKAPSGGRQVFFCSMDGFDLHSSQDWNHWNLLSQLAEALRAFHDSIAEAGLARQVTAFTQSEFGRSLQPSGSGSDHGWGSHHLLLGGAVRGGVHGTLPSLVLGGPDDATNRGTWIPTISTTQLGSTLARWFGASDLAIAATFPTLARFATGDLGFMNAS